MLTIITDSASDFPMELREKFNVFVIPTPVVIDQVDYFDGQTIFTKEFYSILDDTSRDVKTYHINPDMFEKAFLPYAQRGEEVLYLCFSTGIAGTFNAANLAYSAVKEQYPDFVMHIIDSKCASAGFSLLVYKMLLLQQRGVSDEVLIEAANFYTQHIRHIFTVRTLAYLIKGGRLSHFKGYIGTTLHMRPIITLDENGALLALKTIRGQKNAYRALINFVKENAYEPENQTIAFCHGEDEEALEKITDFYDAVLSSREKLIVTVGCAIGAHTGRGVIGICFMDCADPYLKNTQVEVKK